MILNKGGVIERIIRTKIGISELSRLLNVSRTTIYNWFSQENLSIDTVCKIGLAIDYDFANEFPEEFAKEGHQIMSDLISGKLNQQQQMNNSVQYWMSKYILLLEKHNELLSQMSTHSSEASTKSPEITDIKRKHNMNAYLPDHRDHSLRYF